MARRPPSHIRSKGHISYVALTRGHKAVIDTSDVHLVEKYSWSASIKRSGHKYAIAYIDGRPIAMHRLILDTPPHLYVDHMDGDGLNNRRWNIRNCSQTQNMANRPMDKRNLLGIKGVSAVGKRFRASITPSGKRTYLGTYDTIAEASAAYRGAAIVLWGDFAKK